MDEKCADAIRRRVLIRGLGVGCGCLLGAARARNAAAKSSKSSLLYQDHPRDGKRCGECKFFSPDSGGASTGTCAVVEGAIDRNGWCMAFSPKA